MLFQINAESEITLKLDLSIHQRILKKNLNCFTVLNIDNNKNVSWTAYRHIRMISEESRDTEDWSNDAEYSALITGINDIWKYI